MGNSICSFMPASDLRLLGGTRDGMGMLLIPTQPCHSLVWSVGIEGLVLIQTTCNYVEEMLFNHNVCVCVCFQPFTFLNSPV